MQECIRRAGITAGKFDKETDKPLSDDSAAFCNNGGEEGKRMDAYTSFARVYDMFMDDIPYDEWCAYLTGLLQEYGVNDGLVLDLGCGTGTLTELLDDEGYDMIGVDCAEDMLEIAMEKKLESGKDILYLLQDMREFELFGTVRAVVSICDSMNYLLKYEDLVQTLKLVNNYLDPGGVFIFDLNTPYKYETLLADHTIAENREEGSFIWENDFDEESRLNTYALTLFIPEGRGECCSGGECYSSGGWYRKYEEIHVQRAFSLEEIRQAVEEAGMRFLACYDAFTHNPPEDESERVYFVVGEMGKEWKN